MKMIQEEQKNERILKKRNGGMKGKKDKKGIPRPAFWGHLFP